MNSHRWFEPQRNIVHRFIAYLMVLSVLPLLVLGVASFEISRTRLQAQAERHLAELLDERKRYVDLHTEQTEDLIANISGVEAIVTGLAAQHERADNYDRLSMQARIGYILNGYVNIKGLVSIDVFSLNGAHYHVGDTLDTSAVRRHVLDDLYRRALASPRPVYWAGVVDNVNGNSRHGKVITAAKVVYSLRQETSEQVPLGLLLMSHDPDYLRGQFGEQAGGGAMRISLVDGSGRQMVHADARLVGSPLDTALYERLKGAAGQFMWDVDGKPTLVAYRRSEPSGWPLVGFISLAAVNAHAGAIGSATAAVVLLCLGIVVFVAVIYSRRVVTPLHQITDRFKQARGSQALVHDPLPVRGDDDITELTRGFNAFLDGLKEQQRAEQALRQADAERQGRLAAEAANEAKSLFLARMSHDLRTPLNAVLGYAQILKRDGGLNERQQTGLKAIRSSGEHLLMLINDILDLSRIEAGKLDLHPRDVSLLAITEHVAAAIRVKAQEKGLVFSFTPLPGLPAIVRCDETRLRQVLLNLLDNAVKFTDSGHVALRMQALPPPASGGLAQLRFEVEDSGVGMAESEIEASFLPFEQVGDARRRAGGTGLGLAISRQLVRMMGSDIEVCSVVGQGTRFWFDLVLPCAETSEGAAAPVVRAVIGYQGPVKRVLVVDDVAENRAVVNSFLGTLGFDVVEAENGQVGVEKAQALRPDLILMDMVMPVMDGVEATRRLRLDDSLAALPIISVSAIASAPDRARSLAAGANAFLLKPIDFDALITEMQLLLRLAWVYETPAKAAAIEAPRS